ncbi:N-acetylglucosaminyl phosphatidylinositol de-N-acetylase [Scheffersomyces xylosifermentans]|uniref:N-acetylglucosaminyl phosphatidylinositol de-N-acetylase n=1 Tax=Scheffersomyces xylosifermentans TaxID=1304137 RepID=UPI00315DDA38
MIHRIPSYILKVLTTSFVAWIILSTAIPQIMSKYSEQEIQTNVYKKATYPYNSITSPTPLPIQNSTVYFIIGHPDDEVMFFSPSLVEIAKPKNGNDVKLVCFSTGDSVHESMGRIRSEELRQSARILGIDSDNVTILDTFKDGMNVTWDSNEIRDTLKDIVGVGKSQRPVVLITFDENGVSYHPNHISLYLGTVNFIKTYKNSDYKLFVLKSLTFWEKYSFTLLTNVELFVDHISRWIFNNIEIDINISFFTKSDIPNLSSIKFYSDLNMLSVSYAAMCYGHYSQMVWFRYGWLVLSRYLTFNHLIQLN